MKQYKLILLFLIIPFIGNASDHNSTNKQKLKNLEQYYQKALEKWNVPGMAIGIVKDNELILAKGFGLKDINGNKKINKNTNFAIASNTKAFTAAGIMILSEEGKLSLNDKVQDYLPWFELYDPYVSKNMTIRDLLCHRSGLVTFSGDLIWYLTDHSPEEIVRRARYLKPKYGFRAGYGYSNIMFITAGLILEKVSGQSLEEFMKERYFKPLKMDRTIMSITDIEAIGNFASPHIDSDGKVIKIPYANWDNGKAMGGIISNVVDVSKWLKLQLNHGILNGDTIFSPRSQHEMWTPQISRSVSDYSKGLWPSTHFKGYGLGWGLFDYLGRKIIMHTGGYDGTITATVLVPEENLGIVILTNKITSLYSPIMYKTLDAFLGGEDKDWATIILDKINERKNTEEPKTDIIKKTDTLPLDKYLGFYTGNVYGGVNITMENGELYIRFEHTKDFHSKLTHITGNTFEIKFPDAPSLPKGTVDFVLDSNNKVSSLVVDIPNPDFDFTELDLIKQK